MQLVAASKMRQAQEAALRGRPYTLLLAEILGSVSHEHLDDFTHPLLEERAVRVRGVLVISTDKGLCGALNANLFKKIVALRGKVAWIAMGKKATQFLSRTKRELLADFSLRDQVSYADIRRAVNYMIKLYQSKDIDTIEVLFSHYVNTLTQEPLLARLAPISHMKEVLLALRKELKVGGASEVSEKREFLFEPDAHAVLEQLPAFYIKQQVQQRVLEGKASEHSARTVAMKAATDNAQSLGEELSLQYNKLRQASITQEILEIASSSQTAP